MRTLAKALSRLRSALFPRKAARGARIVDPVAFQRALERVLPE